MIYTVMGSLFIIIFGIEIGYTAWMGESGGWIETEPLQGHPVRFNLTGHIIPVTEMNEYIDGSLSPAEHDLPIPNIFVDSKFKHNAIAFMAFINVGKLFFISVLRNNLNNHFSIIKLLFLLWVHYQHGMVLK